MIEEVTQHKRQGRKTQIGNYLASGASAPCLCYARFLLSFPPEFGSEKRQYEESRKRKNPAADPIVYRLRVQSQTQAYDSSKKCCHWRRSA